jgi:Xaa-Pro aminopeptidase
VGGGAWDRGELLSDEHGRGVPGACGVRIEDLVIVAEQGHEVLTGLPKELTVVA